MRWLKNTIKDQLYKRGYEIKPVDSPVLSLASVQSALARKQKFEVVLDVGANIGQTATRYAQIFSSASVYSLEPFTSAYDQLVQNTAGFSNVHPRNCALGESNRTDTINVNEQSYTNSLLKTDEGLSEVIKSNVGNTVDSAEIKVKTLDTFCEEENISHIDWLKIDTQGYEDRVLAGGTHMLTPQRTRAVYLEVIYFPHYEQQGEFDQIYKIMREKGYKLYSLYGVFGKPDEGYLWSDALFVPAEGI